MNQCSEQGRVEELISLYSSRDACAATLLCDCHDPASRAYRIVPHDHRSVDLTYNRLREQSEKFGAALQSLGIRPGDRIATLMGKSQQYLIALMGIWRLGAVHVPLFTAFASPAIVLRLIDSGAKAVICDALQKPKLAPCDEIPENPPWLVITTGGVDGSALSFDALIEQQRAGLPAAVMGGDAPFIHIYTSGTTGRPKGVVVPIRALAAFRIYAEFGLGLRPDDIFWCAADPGWAYGLYFGILASFSTGTFSILFEGGFSPETTMAVLAKECVTNFAAAPTVYRALRGANLVSPGKLSLRCASSAGEPLTP